MFLVVMSSVNLNSFLMQKYVGRLSYKNGIPRKIMNLLCYLIIRGFQSDI
jgi:hypothetical protein